MPIRSVAALGLILGLLAGSAPGWSAEDEQAPLAAPAEGASSGEPADAPDAPVAPDEAPPGEASPPSGEEAPPPTKHKEIEEMVVTATKRAESIQDVPISVSAFDSQALLDSGVTDLSRLQEFVPNLKINPVTDTRGTVIRIRGIGSPGNNSGIDPSVGVFIDGVYQGRTGMSLGDLLDIERIEVLRGPQGTLYGKNTAAGAINVHSKKPSHEFEGLVEGVVGDYDQYEGRATFNFPIVPDRVASRVAAYWVTRDGFDHNVFDGSEVNDANKLGGRIRTLFDVSDDFSFILSGDYSYENTLCCVPDIQTYEGYPSLVPQTTFQSIAAQPGNPPLPEADGFDRELGVNVDPKNRVKVGGVSLDATYQLEDLRWLGSSTVDFLGAYRAYSSDSRFDGDFSIYDAVLAFTDTALDQYSAELRLTSPSGERLEYVLGLYAYYQRQETTDRNGFEQDFVDVFPLATEPAKNVSDNVHKTTSYAAFGQATYELSSWASLTGGLRYTYEKKERDGVHQSDPETGLDAPPVLGPRIELDQTRRTTNWSPMVALRFFPADDVMLYLSYARGFKSGGFNQLRTLVSVPGEFDDEKSQNYELGARTSWLERRLTANATLFYTDYEDFQAQTFDGSSINVLNAGSFESYGIEAELVGRPTDFLTFTASFGYNVTEYDDFENAIQTAEQRFNETSGFPIACGFDTSLSCVQDLTGERLDSAPRWKVTSAVHYERPLPGQPISWFLRGEHVYTSKQWLDQDLDDNLLQGHTNVYNLRAGLRAEDGRWEVTGWVQNLTDEGYNVIGFDVPTLNGFAAINAPPRQFGVTLRYRF